MKNKILKNDTLKTILIYTGLFALICSLILFIFSKYDKVFIWSGDGTRQHIVTFHYFRSLLVELIKTGSISTFTWNISLGIDLFSNFAYYILGDFFAYFSIFFSTKSLESVFSLLIFVRLYFIGISFIAYCKYKKMNNISSIIGSLIYTFCTYALFAGPRHPYFINAIIIFPLLMIGIEKAIKEDKFIFFTIIVAIMFISNFYFAYMFSLIIAIYGIILAIYTYKKDGYKKIIKVLSKTLLFSIIGIMISAVVLLPTIIDFFNSERTNANVIYPYSIGYYRNFVNNILLVSEKSYWTYIGVQSIILLAFPWFIRNRKENYPLFITMIILFIPLLISQIGSIFCGFGYPNNRWSFVMAFIFSFIIVNFINKSPTIDRKLLHDIIIGIIIFLGVNVAFHINFSYTSISQILLAIVILLVMLNKEKLNIMIKKISIYNILLLSVVFIGIISSVKYFYDIEGVGYVSVFLDKNGVKKSLDTSHGTIEDFDKITKYIKKEDHNFYRISKYPYDHENVSLIKNFNSMGQYYSITPRVYGNLNNDLKNSQYYLSLGSKEFDYRTKITTLLGVKYLITTNNKVVPYGYKKLNNYKGKSSIYKNNYALPFGVLYTNYINETEYNSLNALEKESSLLKTTVLNKDNKNISKYKGYNYNNTIKEINYKVNDKNNILKNKNKIVINNTTMNNIKFNVGNIKNSEIYLSIEGLEFDPTKIETKSPNTESKINIERNKNQNKWKQPHYGYYLTANFNNFSKTRSIKDKMTDPYYMDINDFLFNLGYYDKTSGDITLSFTKAGTYTFDKIKVYAVSMDDYKEDINNLKQSNFKIKEYKNGYLKGTVNASSSGILQFSTMYNKGFKVFVDNEEVKTFTSNKYFLGIEIESGSHEIIIKYKNPYIKMGLLITLSGITILIGYSLIIKRKYK